MTGGRWVIGLVLAATLAGQVQAGILGASTQDCVKLKRIKAESAETESNLIVHTSDGRAYRNKLQAPCDGLLGLNDLGKLRMEGKDGLLCAGDLVWLDRPGIASSLGMGGDGNDAGCKLGAFEPISEMSLSEALRR